jgi:phosphate transport system substrate-binding protein
MIKKHSTPTPNYIISIKLVLGILILSAATIAITLSCKKGDAESGEEQTFTSGTAKILVDNTVQPFIEDALAVFLNTYDRAHITQVNSTEREIVQALMNDSIKVAVLPRKLTKDEESHFAKKKIVHSVTEFGKDAVALITNQRAIDSVINLEEVLKVLRGEKSSKVSSLVFDNPNSSTVQLLLKMAGVKQVPATGIYSLKTNEEVIKYVHDNNGAIGIIGVNWLLQSPVSTAKYVENIKVLAVDNVKIDKGEKKYYKPNQSNMATGSYPLTRTLYLLNYLGKDGLGMGFATYLRAQDGQRLILKSGLLPVEMPTREINVQTKNITTQN